MKQDVSSNEIFDELKKKVLELCDTIDKQNDLIKKYQKALRIAASDLEEALNEEGGCYYIGSYDKSDVGGTSTQYRRARSRR